MMLHFHKVSSFTLREIDTHGLSNVSFIIVTINIIAAVQYNAHEQTFYCQPLLSVLNEWPYLQINSDDDDEDDDDYPSIYRL